ncbi:hypothetical protein [Actinokineospora globicatena]|uniref:DUF397 domain-containing protein n=1 Tax=Actinokineospora globicatena TaxID=103729 RepID=A0A9W6VBX7_9PSEU|nr:hypothetical protein [Actinokineospora globicatena]GLW95747.1 hypothetical protein Aglo03_65630 [Actinokineospora globicatena]
MSGALLSNEPEPEPGPVVNAGFRRASRCTTGACVLLSLSGDRLRVRGNAPHRELGFPAAAATRLVRAIAGGLLTPDPDR